uniref:Uncharacterized protein n=1 Tax=Lepeophtheirus salmonis TaxID=72036 RepID=A0A0K2VLP9_LEPSM
MDTTGFHSQPAARGIH